MPLTLCIYLVVISILFSLYFTFPGPQTIPTGPFLCGRLDMDRPSKHLGLMDLF